MERIGRYQVQRRISSATSVYVVSDPDTGAESVVKMIPSVHCEGPEDLARFQEDLLERTKAAAALQHPKIVPVKEIFQEYGLIWAVVELVKGASLPEVLSAPEPFPKEKLRRVFRQAAECLDYAHERKVFHGGLKPSKVMVQENGIVRILGFGLAEPTGKRETEDDSPDPSLRHRSPEQMQGASADAPSDQFALAAAVYEALAGQFPGSQAPLKVGNNTLTLSPPLIETINTTLSAETGKVLSRALSVVAKDRYKSCAEFISALEAALETAPDWKIASPGLPGSEEFEDRDFTPVFTEDVEVPEERRFFGLFRINETSEGRRWSVPSGVIWLLVAVMASALYLGSEMWGGSDAPTKTARLLPEAGIGVTYEQSLTPENQQPPFSWEIVSGALPPGLTLDPQTGTVRGVPETPGRFRWDMRMTDSASVETERTFVVDVATKLAVASSPVLPTATVDNNYSYSLFSVGEGYPHRWSIVEGELPPGLILDPMGAMIQGMPTSTGVYEFTVQVTDALGGTATSALHLKVDSGLAIISPGELPAAILDSNYSQELVAVSGSPPYVWEITEGALPSGLSLDEKGRIRGRPTSPGESNFTLRVRDATGASAESEGLLRVRSGLTITTAPTLPAASVGSAYHVRLAVGGGRGRYSWAVQSGSLPAGLSLGAQTGQLSGTPSSAGSHRITIRVRDTANAEASQAFTLEVRDPLTITTEGRLPASSTGAAYSARVNTSGGTAPLRFAVTSGSLPPGLALDAAQGTLTGTPRAAGNFRFSVAVTDAARVTTAKPFDLAVDRGFTVTTASPLRQAEVQQTYSERLEAGEGNPPYSWRLAEGSLPPGLALDPAGRVFGTPTAEGQFNFAVEAVDSSGAQARKPLTVLVVSALRMPTLSVLPEGSVGRPYSHQMTVSGGSPPFTWSVGQGTLPAGLALDPASGVISGRPTTPGAFRFEVQVTSSTRVSLTQPSELTVRPSSSGEIVWTGSLEGDSILTIQDGQYPSVGSLAGSLPGVPVQIQVEPAAVSVVTAPGPENDWKLLVINTGGQPRTRITVRWSTLQ